MRIVIVIRHRPGRGQPRRLVADQSHAVAEEVHVVVILRFGEARLGGSRDRDRVRRVGGDGLGVRGEGALGVAGRLREVAQVDDGPQERGRGSRRDLMALLTPH